MRKILAILLIGLTVFPPAVAQTNVRAAIINNTRYADQFLVGSSSGGTVEAYQNCPATSGCTVALGADVTVTGNSTITIADAKPLVLDLQGHKITVIDKTLSFTDNNINSRTPLVIQNGTMACSFTGSNTGYKFFTMTNVTLFNVNFLNCDHSGTAVLWDDVEDSAMYSVGFRFNGLGFQAQNATNENNCYACKFDSNVNAVLLKDIGGFHFTGGLVQSNTGQHSFSVVTTAGNNSTEFRATGVHFENNGDGTAASRQIYIAPAAAQVQLNVSLVGNIFTQGAFAPGSYPIEVAGSQNVQPILTEMNQYNGYSTAVMTGATQQYRHASIGDNGVNETCDVCLMMPNGNGDAGIAFRPEGATHNYQIFAGHPADFQGFLQFWDETANASILSFNGTTWTFPADVRTNGAFTTAGNVAFSAGLVDFTGAEIVTSGLPVRASDTGNIVISQNSSSFNSTQLTVKHNLEKVEFDNARGGFIFAPNTGLFAVKDGSNINVIEVPVAAGNVVFNNSHGLIGYLNDHSAPQWSITAGGIITGEGLTTSGNAQLANIIATGSVYPDGAGLKHKRVTFNAAAGTVDVTVTWGTAFADVNYTHNCEVFNGNADTTGWQTIGKLAASVTVRVTGTGAHVGQVLECSAFHD